MMVLRLNTGNTGNTDFCSKPNWRLSVQSKLALRCPVFLCNQVVKCMIQSVLKSVQIDLCRVLTICTCSR